MFRQTDIAILCPIRHEALSELRLVLAQLAEELAQGGAVICDQLTENHFMRWVILESAEGIDGHRYEPQLLLSSNIDGDPQVYLSGLIQVDSLLIQKIYQCCKGFPDYDAAMGEPPVSDILAYWQSYTHVSNAFYVGALGRSRQTIKREAQLVAALQAEIDHQQISEEGLAHQSAISVRESLQKYVRKQPEFEWALLPESSGRWQDILAYFGIGIALLIVVGLVATAFWLPLFILIGAWLLGIRYLEEQDDEARIENWQHHYDHVANVAVEEDHVQQNPMTSITEIKPGRLRLWTLRAVLSLINFSAKYIFIRGNLGGISTIHFARWLIIDEGRRLLFLSNYDGSWAQYLGDFVDRASRGLTAIWSNTRGFPKTRWLVFDGARHVQKFKSYARASQLPTQFWYTGYRRLSIANINNNSHIRAGLLGDMDREAAEAWLRRF